MERGEERMLLNHPTTSLWILRQTGVTWWRSVIRTTSVPLGPHQFVVAEW